jgi:exodeoxyribonuclease V gamma subunit
MSIEVSQDEETELLNKQHNISSGLLNKLRAEGKLPAGQTGELALRPLTKQSTDLAQQITQLSQSINTSQSVDIELLIDDITLLGRVGNLYGQDLILWRTGKLRAKDRIALYLQWLCLCADSSKTTLNQAHFISTEKLYSLPVVAKEAALQQLTIWLKHWQRGADQILHFYPEAAWQWVTSQDLNKTLNTFKGNDFAAGEGSEAHIQRVCPELAEHFENFSQIAESLLLPLVALGEAK